MINSGFCQIEKCILVVTLEMYFWKPDQNAAWWRKGCSDINSLVVECLLVSFSRIFNSWYLMAITPPKSRGCWWFWKSMAKKAGNGYFKIMHRYLFVPQTLWVKDPVTSCHSSFGDDVLPQIRWYVQYHCFESWLAQTVILWHNHMWYKFFYDRSYFFRVSVVKFFSTVP